MCVYEQFSHTSNFSFSYDHGHGHSHMFMSMHEYVYVCTVSVYVCLSVVHVRGVRTTCIEMFSDVCILRMHVKFVFMYVQCTLHMYNCIYARLICMYVYTYAYCIFQGTRTQVILNIYEHTYTNIHT